MRNRHLPETKVITEEVIVTEEIVEQDYVEVSNQNDLNPCNCDCDGQEEAVSFDAAYADTVTVIE